MVIILILFYRKFIEICYVKLNYNWLVKIKFFFGEFEDRLGFGFIYSGVREI